MYCWHVTSEINKLMDFPLYVCPFRLWSNPAVAVFTGATSGLGLPNVHLLDWRRLGVQDVRPHRGEDPEHSPYLSLSLSHARTELEWSMSQKDTQLGFDWNKIKPSVMDLQSFVFINASAPLKTSSSSTPCFISTPTGGQALGPVQEQTQDELWEAEPRPALLLPQEHHPQDGWQTLCLPLRLRRAGHAGKDGPGGADQYECSAHQHRVVAVPGRGDVGPQQRNVGIAVREHSQGTAKAKLSTLGVLAVAALSIHCQKKTQTTLKCSTSGEE